MIHPTAIIETSTPLCTDIEVGPYAVITGDIHIPEGCTVEAHAQLLNQVILGKNCRIGAGSVLGGDPQDLGFDSATISGIILGDNNTVRENVTIHRSAIANGLTRLGQGNYLNAGAHVGHDVLLGDNNVLGNASLLGGHVVVGNRNEFGAAAACHQFVRVGDLTKVYDLGGLSSDLPHFLSSEAINILKGINYEGLREAGLDEMVIEEIERVYTLLVTGDKNTTQALTAAAEIDWKSQEARDFIEFFRADSRKGICSKL